MSDRRHQRNGKNEWNERFQKTAATIYGVWNFYRMNLETGKTEPIKEGRALLEIGTARVVESVRSSPARRAHFGFAYHSSEQKDVDYFDAVAELKRGAKIYTPKFVYWAILSLPAKAEAQVSQAAA